MTDTELEEISYYFVQVKATSQLPGIKTGDIVYFDYSGGYADLSIYHYHKFDKLPSTHDLLEWTSRATINQLFDPKTIQIFKVTRTVRTVTEQMNQPKPTHVALVEIPPDPACRIVAAIVCGHCGATVENCNTVCDERCLYFGPDVREAKVSDIIKGFK